MPNVACTYKPDGWTTIKNFWDEVAENIVKFRVRILVGDWNMQLFCVILELRARGIHINLAAWYPFAPYKEEKPFIDSMGLFIIGPVSGIKKVQYLTTPR